MWKIHINISLAVCVFMIRPALPAVAATHYVSPGQRIQTAIDKANKGDEIEVAPGTYNEAIDFRGKAVRLYSSGGAKVTTIDGTGSYHVVRCASGENASTILEGFTITGGDANGPDPNDDLGGGLHCFSSSPTVTGCIFTDNTAVIGGGMMSIYGNPTVSNCTFSYNTAGNAGGIYCGESNMTLTGCTFTNNLATEGGGIYIWTCNPTLTGCTFSGNRAINHGGGIRNYRSSPTVIGCTFTGNTATFFGGGMYNNSYSSPTITNCLFNGNFADTGGGMSSYTACEPTVTNCTFSGNRALFFGGGMANYSASKPRLYNCILWNNTSDYEGEQITIWNGSVISVNYCDIEGGEGQIHKNASCTIDWGTGNLDAEPAFVGPGYWDENGTPADVNDDFWRGGDYHLAVGSPCIDTGDNGSLPADTADLDNDGNTVEPIPWDIDTDVRVSGGTVDMGSDEVIWDIATGIGPGGSVTLNPGGGPDDPNTEAIVVFDNNSVEDANITVVEMSGDAHPPTGGFEGLGTTLRIDSSVADGEFFMTVMIPFDGDDLGGQDPLNVDLMWWDGEAWVLAVAGNKGNSPGKTGPVGDRYPVEDKTPPELSSELGDYGVYWNPNTEKGFVWANVDHVSDFAGLAHNAADFEPDGNVDFVDFAYLAKWWQDIGCGLCGGADLTNDGNVDRNDLREFTDWWLAGSEPEL